MPILANVLLSASDGNLKLSATNLELTAVVTTKAEVKSSGSTTVNARVLSEIVRELPDCEVQLNLSEGERLEIIAGKSKFKMVGVSAEEYPSLPGMGINVSNKIDTAQFLEMIGKTVYAVSLDETRFNLNGVCFECESVKGSDSILKMVATDGHRLAMISRPIEGIKFDGSAIVPTRGLAELRKIIDEQVDKEISAEISEGFFVIETRKAKVAMRLVDGEFPDYNQVMPKEEGVIASIAGGDLSQAVKRMALMVTDRGKCIKFDFSENSLRLSSSSPELGESSEELEIAYTGEPLSVGFNAKYVQDFAASLDESQRINIELNGELGPGKFFAEGDESYIGIVMPMRLS